MRIHTPSKVKNPGFNQKGMRKAILEKILLERIKERGEPSARGNLRSSFLLSKKYRASPREGKWNGERERVECVNNL